MKELFMKKIGEWLKNKIYKIFNKTEDEKVNINVNGSNNNINVINGGKEIMDLIARCKYCGKEFLQKDNFDFQEDCMLHEVEHLNLKERFNIIIEKAINILNKKYNLQTYYKDIEINVNYDYVDNLVDIVECRATIYFNEYVKKYGYIHIFTDTLEEDLDLDELIENMEVNYKKYINGEFNINKKS